MSQADRRSPGRGIVAYLDTLLPGSLLLSLKQAIPFWIASLLVGLIAVAYAKLFSFTEALLEEILEGRLWMIFAMAPLSFLLAWFLVQLFAPNAKGSGIPQVMAAIDLATLRNDSYIDKLLSFRILVTKVASSFMMILGGGAIGREGPTIQIAASVFHMVNKLIPASWPKLSNQNFILTGAAAGLAAAFNTPLGGIVFAMEELAKVHIRFFRTALFSAVIIAGLTAQALLGPYLYLGYPDVKGLHFTIFFGVAAVAIISGIAGSVMCKGILKLLEWKKSFTRKQNMILVIGSGLAVALIAYFIDRESIGSGKELMNEALFTKDKSVSWYTVLTRIAGPMIAFNTGAAAGIFAPSLAAGASIGAWVSHVFNVTGADANILILSGMVGFLTGVTRTPFTSAILVLEMTDRHSVIFHMMLAALLSGIASVLIDKHSFYGQLKKHYVKDALTDKSS
jgi:H+/Cl- antiporter ClcA